MSGKISLVLSTRAVCLYLDRTRSCGRTPCLLSLVAGSLPVSSPKPALSQELRDGSTAVSICLMSSTSNTSLHCRRKNPSVIKSITQRHSPVQINLEFLFQCLNHVLVASKLHAVKGILGVLVEQRLNRSSRVFVWRHSAARPRRTWKILVQQDQTVARRRILH
jgi:hypothetical protein